MPRGACPPISSSSRNGRPTARRRTTRPAASTHSRPGRLSGLRTHRQSTGAGPGPRTARSAGEAWSRAPTNQPVYAWTDLTYLLHKHHVSWGYYVVSGSEPDCENDAAETCAPVVQNSHTPGIWNPLPWFNTVQNDHQLGNIRDVEEVLRCSQGRHPAGGVVGGSLGRGERAPASSGQLRSELRDQPHQRCHEEPGLELDRHLPCLGRLGRLLRPRHAADGRPERLRPAGAGHRHQPVCQEGLRRSPDAELRCLRQVHRGRLPAGPAADPATDGRPDPRPDVRENEKPYSAISRTTSTSPRLPGRRPCCRSTRRQRSPARRPPPRSRLPRRLRTVPDEALQSPSTGATGSLRPTSNCHTVGRGAATLGVVTAASI